MNSDALANHLRRSLKRQERVFQKTLILNPVENIPFEDDIKYASSFLHGLYNTDKSRTYQQKLATVAQFSGRDRIAYDIRLIYKSWAEAIGAECVSMRLLSGLHAHSIVFMTMAQIGDSVLLLPEEAGGHVATKTILRRLGINVVDMIVDYENRRIAIDKTVEVAKRAGVKFVFVDRSEGLHFEDFSELISRIGVPSIFDASQYLTNIVAGHFTNPFRMGFDFIISTLHKNFPGPQRALVAAKKDSSLWQAFSSHVSTYVSNMHSFGIYAAGLTLARREWVNKYSQEMLRNAVQLEKTLSEIGIPVVSNKIDVPHTHHLWISASSREEAFEKFQRLERHRILTNYRKLPYGLGFGLRLGTSAATRLGLRSKHLLLLSELIRDSLNCDFSLARKRAVEEFVLSLSTQKEEV